MADNDINQGMFGVRSRTQCSYQDFGFQTLTLMPADGYFGLKPDGLPVLISDTAFPTMNDLSDRLFSLKISPDPSPYQFLADMVYLYSNNMMFFRYDTFVVFSDFLQDCFPRPLLLRLFKSNLASIRSLWGSMFNSALSAKGPYRHPHGDCRRALCFLINIALDLHPEWIDEDKDRILYAAVFCGDKSMVKKIVGRGALPTYSHPGGTIFQAAAEFHSADCVEIIMQGCGIDLHGEANGTEKLSFVGGSALNAQQLASIFSTFFCRLALHFSSTPHLRHEAHLDNRMSGNLAVLRVILKAGADVDATYPHLSSLRVLYDGWGIPSQERPSYLDISFYLFAPLFELMLPYSCSAGLTRGGLCRAAQAGKERLADYLDSVLVLPDTSTSRFIELVLVEQFLFFESDDSDRVELVDISGRTARTLIEYGICFNACHFGSKPLRAVILTIERYGFNEDREFLLESLLHWGTCIDSSALEASVSNTGTEVLTRLIHFGADVIEKGTEALIKAAYIQNLEALSLLLSSGAHATGSKALLMAARAGRYEAMSLLLRSGIDINGEFRAYGKYDLGADGADGLATVVCQILLRMPYLTVRRDWRDARDWSKESVHFLINKGARLTSRSGDSTCFELLERLLRNGKSVAFRFVLEFKEETTRLTPSQWSELLFTWLEGPFVERGGNEDVINILLGNCEHPLEKPILAESILAHCSVQAVQNLIQSGADMNEVSDAPTPLQAAAICRNAEIFLLLLEKGADVNAPARSSHQEAGTALQAVCGWSIFHGTARVSYQLAVPLIRALLDRGADVNASPYGRRSATALQLVCGWESLAKNLPWKIEVIKMLLDHGADANAPAYGWNGATALQVICAQELHDREAANLAHELMVLLLEHGADVNARPSVRGNTALQYCAYRGRLKDLLVLVQHGADPNSYPRNILRNIRPLVLHARWHPNLRKGHLPWSGSRAESVLALDMAADRGRLDIVQYLLNIGAISGNPGTTGFEGAIYLAEASWHPAIADIIRKHSQKVAEDATLNIDGLIKQYAAACGEKK